AQPGSALRSGRRGPQFKSGHPDEAPLDGAWALGPGRPEIGRSAHSLHVARGGGSPRDGALPACGGGCRTRLPGAGGGGARRFAPGVADVVIWNEANSVRFWRPQRGAAAAYEALLADCYDELHAVRKRLNVVTSTAPHDDPGRFVTALGAAYRASGRHERI